MAGADTNTHQFLRTWRKHRNKTLESVTEKIGSKVNTISGWETGKRRINLDDLARLAALYEVSPADLLQSPEAYEQRKAVGRVAAIVSRLHPDQVARWMWFGEAIAPIEPQTAGLDPPPKAKRVERLPFQAGGNAQQNLIHSAQCPDCVRPPPAMTVMGA